MKKYLVLASALLIASFSMQSCGDNFTDPGEELGAGSVTTNPNTPSQGNDINSIKYIFEPTEDGVRAAIDEMNKNYILQTIPSGTYCLRGGKIQDGVVYKPASHAYQRQYNFGPDLYAQYFTTPHKDFMYGSHTSTYDLSADFNGGAVGAYTMAKNAFMPVLHHPMIDSIPEIKAIVLLFYSLSAQENADLSGPFTYIEDKQNSENPTTYNTVKDIYTGIEANLNTIVECLKYYEEEGNRPDWYKTEIRKILSKFDLTRSWDNGDNSMNPYIKLANSIKLRMAMHMTKVDNATAKEWAEEAVASGVIEATGDQMGFFQSYDAIGHPLVEIQNWGDTRLSASFESLLMSINHPYTKILFKPNNNLIVNREDNTVLEADTRICGIRSGVYVGTGQDYSANQYQAYSTFDTDMMSESPLYFIKWSEVDFLRAEGALRGWDMGGSAQEFYERGIKNADLVEPTIAEIEWFGKPYSAYVEEYMAQTEATPYTNIDPIGDGEPWESVTTIGVAWNEGDDNETKLEKIITQKYIALFPLSTEAWTELRRTGYPKLFPVLNPEDGDGSLKDGELIRRIPWVPTDPAAKEMVNNSGIPALGGADKQATRLWWDVDAPNF